MKQRTISAVIMIAIILPIIYLGDSLFEITVTTIGVFALYEFLKVSKLKLPKVVILSNYTLLVVGILSGKYIFNIVILTILIQLLLSMIKYKKEKTEINYNFYLILITIIFEISFNSVINTRLNNIDFFIFLILIGVITDTFAYIIGSLIGKNKLCPKISPKKTIEGSFFGTVFAVLIGIMYYVYYINYNINVLTLILLIIGLSIFGQLGDLFFSNIKRNYKVKDYSNLIKGHGGVLDRLDSIIFIFLTYEILKIFL